MTLSATRYAARLAEAIGALERARNAPRRELWRAARDVEHLVLADLAAPEETDEILRRLGATGHLARCQEIFARLEPVIERDFARSGGTLEDREGITAGYLVRYEELARREVALAEMTREDHVLFIGSGPLPISAIEYCRQTGCRVDCLDFVKDAIGISREVIGRMGLAERMRCHVGRGEQFPAAGYSVILVGVLAAPKPEILRNIVATATKESRVLLRTTFGLRRLIYESIAPALTSAEAMRNATVSEARGDQVLSAIRGLDLEVAIASRTGS